MKRARAVGALAACVLSLASVPASKAQERTSLFKVGIRYRTFTLNKPYNWRGAKTHGLITTVWYPAVPSAVEQSQWIGGPGKPLFSAGKAAPNSPMVSSPSRFPLIVLSHGTGGSAAMMAWLGTVLAAHGYIAAAVNHPGNNGYDGYTPEGFSTWWERARDLSTVIDELLAEPTWDSHTDCDRIGAAGFSLGGYTMIQIAGGITDVSAYNAFCRSVRADNICKSPPEFPDLVDQFNRLSTTDPEFKAALSHAGDSYHDPRIRAVFAMAPALGPAFTAPSLQKIAISVEIVAGAKDENVPIESSAKYFAAQIPGAKLTVLPGNIGHYVFLDSCTEEGRKVLPLLCTDAPGVDRDAIHASSADMALAFFAQNLRTREPRTEGGRH